jgi:DNA-binding CsgD family transcriptional regulator
MFSSNLSFSEFETRGEAMQSIALFHGMTRNPTMTACGTILTKIKCSSQNEAVQQQLMMV